MKKANWTLLLILIICNSCHSNQPPINRIAHAGGGIEKQRYTNTLEALNSSYKSGFCLFELDFSWTQDHQLVCLHDWKNTAKRLFKHDSGQALTLSEFKTQTQQFYHFTPCDLSSLKQWLSNHPEAYVITDIKGEIEAGHQLIADTLPNHLEQFIPQFTKKKHYQTIRSQGFSRLIWTLFSYNGSPETLATDRKNMELFAITMPKTKANDGWALTIRDTPTYVHTINDQKTANNYIKNLGVTSVYTDFLPANQVHE